MSRSPSLFAGLLAEDGDVLLTVAQGAFSETTIGYSVEDDGKLWQALFHTPRFRVQLVNDVTGVSLCGALKNIVAVAAGVVDGEPTPLTQRRKGG